MWLVFVPVACASAPWFLLAIAPRSTDNNLDPWAHFIIAAFPVAGLLVAGTFLISSQESRRLPALVPSAFAAAGFATGEITMGVLNGWELQFTSEWYVNVQLLATTSLFLLPICAAASGLDLVRRLRSQ